MMYSFVPRSEVVTDIPGLPFGRVPFNYLRDNMVKTLDRQDVEFDLMVQVQTDPHLMPIENAADPFNPVLEERREPHAIWFRFRGSRPRARSPSTARSCSSDPMSTPTWQRIVRTGCPHGEIEPTRQAAWGTHCVPRSRTRVLKPPEPVQLRLPPALLPRRTPPALLLLPPQPVQPTPQPQRVRPLQLQPPARMTQRSSCCR